MHIKNVLIIGGGSSIGQSVIEQFANNGCAVLATYRSNVPKNPTVRSITAAKLDLLSPDTFSSFTQNYVEKLDGIDVAIFLSGILPGKALSDYDDLMVDQVMATNFSSQVKLLRRLLPHFRSGGRILFVSSIAGERGSFDPIYAASKAAQNAVVKSLATWLAPQITVNAIAPSLIEDSRMYDEMLPERRKHHLDSSPTKRLNNKNKISGIIYDLCGPNWDNLNGQIIGINGGVYV